MSDFDDVRTILDFFVVETASYLHSEQSETDIGVLTSIVTFYAFSFVDFKQTSPRSQASEPHKNAAVSLNFS